MSRFSMPALVLASTLALGLAAPSFAAGTPAPEATQISAATSATSMHSINRKAKKAVKHARRTHKRHKIASVLKTNAQPKAN